MRGHDYRGVFTADGARRVTRKAIPEVPAEAGLVVEDAGERVLRRRRRRRRAGGDAGGPPRRPSGLPAAPGGVPRRGRGRHARRPDRAAQRPSAARSASGSVKVVGHTARTARAARIWVEGLHDAELVERVWGHDLRVEGIVVEPMHGMDDLAAAVAAFGPGPQPAPGDPGRPPRRGDEGDPRGRSRSSGRTCS